MATKKFSELPLINALTIDDLDIFAVSDETEGEESKKIKFGEIRKAIINDDTFDITNTTGLTNIGNIVDNINLYNPNADGKNTLNATNIYVTGQGYVNSSYLLNYNNLSNQPDIPEKLSDLTNEGGFLQYLNEVPPKIVWNVPSAEQVQVNTDFIPEGNTESSNLYYTNQRVREFFDVNFSDYYNQLNAAFDNGLIRDSLIGIPATFKGPNLNILQSSQIEITDLSIESSYQVGQVLRLYGASLEDTVETLSGNYPAFGFGVEPLGFATDAADPTYVSFGYKVCLFDITTGVITEASPEEVVGVSVPTTSTVNNVYDLFNTDYFLRLSFTNLPTNKGVLVYRRDGVGNPYNLVAVLGRKEAFSGIWIDYYTFDLTAWGGKNQEDNSYVLDPLTGETNIVHFPLSPPALPLRGWVDVEVLSKDTSEGTLKINLSSSVFINPSYTCEVCHNDTSKIQGAINTNSAVGRKSILLNAKTYVSGRILVPDNFGIEGTTSVTKIVKLPWSGGEVGALNSKMIEAVTEQGASTITLVGLDLDGNAVNTMLFPDESDYTTNYCIDLGTQADNITIDRVRIRNVCGGGINMTGVDGLKMTTSEIRDSAVTDRYLASPLVADDGKTTVITGNIFENFTDYVDVSLTNKGVIANNIVNNCGSGLFIYGSRFLISSPNVLIGPANEFIPTPDIFNSEFDQVNIDLSSSYSPGADYISTAIKYQENGEDYDLTQTDGTISNIEYSTFTVKKSATTGVEEIYTPRPKVSGIDFTFNTSTITTNNSNLSIFRAGETILVSGAGNNNGYYTVSGTPTETSLTVVETFNENVGPIEVSISGEEIDPIPMFDATDTNSPRSEGNIRYSIPSASIDSLVLADGTRSFSRLYSYDNEHTGWVWKVTYEYELAAATITDQSSGLWRPEDNGVSDPRYVVTASNVKYLRVGQRVKFGVGANSHVGFGVPAIASSDIKFSGSTITSTDTDLSVFSQGETIYIKGSNFNDGTYVVAGTPTATSLTVTEVFTTDPDPTSDPGLPVTITGEYGSFANADNINTGIIDFIDDTQPQAVQITIRFPGANPDLDGDGLVAGTGGTLNIIDKFVLAQGRIY